ncbi:DoxX-like family protein [Streptomyces sp. PTM05]|uniref:DoxX-like family protein n=1 Tax=Streptantibioticus parmotrematis TaxID=2873249 RepID=A0ABS7QY88_9ACTN|nr:DoxX-like family protein [Streptantibioticus parmotrematis]MBY8886754.1 DoxX-like family protein [Streptantibioticus parmotrematis]
MWFYEGLWCKVFPGRADQRAIIADIPFLPGWAVVPLMVSIGLAEAAVGIWAFSGRRPYLAAAVQTWLIVSFNAGGLLFAAGTIDEPGRLIVTDLALVALFWLVAERRAIRR